MDFSVPLPPGTRLDGKYLIAFIDADNTTEESNERNNYVLYGENE